jgi:alanine racemase
MKIIKEIQRLKKKFSSNQTLINVFISKKNIIYNLNQFKNNYPDLKFTPVLKSNAYGHGLIEIAEILKKEKKPFLAVDSLFEAKKLRNFGISENILVIGYIFPKEILNNKLKNISYFIVDLSQLKFLSEKARKKINIHLKIDTGMHRQGIEYSQMSEAVKLIKNNERINLEGLCSHLSDADGEENEFTLNQIKKWNDAVDKFKKEFKSIKYFHLSATPGLKYSKKIKENMSRLGCGLYGFDRGLGLDLKPALSIKTYVTSIRHLRSGGSVGYNATFKADKEMKIATIPFGYFEGFDRRLSDKGFVKVKEEFCPIVGRVSMNITSFDVTGIDDIKVGDEVLVISSNPKDKNSVIEISKVCNTIPYVILAGIQSHLKRIISK